MLEFDPPLAPKSMDFDLQGLKKQGKSTPRDPQNDPKCIPKATLLQRMPSELHFLKIWWFVGAKMLSKSTKKCSKNDNEKRCFFRDVFSLIWHDFWSKNGLKINLRRSKADFRKAWFYQGKTYVFQVRALRKATFYTSKRALEKRLWKTWFVSDFDFDFDPPNASKSGPKRDSFFDAMGIARSSPETTGGHTFWVTYLGIHIIRSTIYIIPITKLP